MGTLKGATFHVFFIVFSIAIFNVEGRAVNISNTWMLPEEDFPVFYRYFRDRISWYEADSVCQFHHGNLVTADTSNQYDAIRAYLKELDIIETVWIGLTKKGGKSTFTWSDFQPLRGEGHFQEAIPKGNDALCVSVDPASDFFWKSQSCGGPDVASFICELPVPSWALGTKGCMLTELPSLTVLYFPEQMAVELTSDCGLDGTKRIACKGNADREELSHQLTCVISTEDYNADTEKASKATQTQLPQEYHESNSIPTAAITSNIKTSQNVKPTQNTMWTVSTVDLGIPTRHRRETEDTPSPIETEKGSTEVYEKLTTEAMKISTPPSTLSALKMKPEAVATLLITTKASLPSSTSSSDKSSELTSTQVVDFSTQHNNKGFGMLAAEQDLETTTTSNYSKTADEPLLDDIAEYPSAINQGQLFSIIENGTMFDIIEINGTEPWDAKTAKEETIKSSEATQTPLPTTEKTTQITNIPKIAKPKNIKKLDAIKDDKKIQTNSKITTLQTEDPMLNKEVEIFPAINQKEEVVLSRTNRKELPGETLQKSKNEHIDLESGSNFGLPKILNFSITNELNNDNSHQIKLENFANIEKTILDVAESTNKNGKKVMDVKIVETKFTVTEPKKTKLIDEKTKSIKEKAMDEIKIGKTSFKNKKFMKKVSPDITKIEADVETFVLNPENTTMLEKIKIVLEETENQTDSHKHATVNPLQEELMEKLYLKHKPITTETPAKIQDISNSNNTIDPKLDILNFNVTLDIANNETELIQSSKPEKIQSTPSTLPTEKYLPKSLIKTTTPDLPEDDLTTNETTTKNAFDTNVTPARPNRKRTLVKTRAKNFYPYYFSRVLG